MEKIKFGNAVYDLVPAGTHYAGEQLRLVIAWPEGVAYEEIEASLTDCDRIEIISEVGEMLEAIKGYTCVDRLVKQHDYVIGVEQIKDGENEAGEPLYINREVVGSVMIATLKRPDIRETVESMREMVDYLFIKELEG